MMTPLLRQGLLAAAAAAAGLACASPNEPILPIPQSAGQDPARAELGRRLFGDARLSASGTVSCASCHDLAKGGADGRARSVGHLGERTAMNAPTVLNAALNFRQFWNGGADSLEAQVDQVIRNPVEMGANWQEVVRRVSLDPGYRTAFGAAYRDGVSKANIQNAIATFERTLVTPDARFDQYLRGKTDALSAQEKAGYAAFKQYGCMACHQGVNVGGNMFQRFGVLAEPGRRRGADASPADLGRYLVTGLEADRYVFKVPGLRNVALTAPYFHDASAPTLAAAVDVMFRVQLGRAAPEADKAAIVAFLHTLTGTLESAP